MNEGKKIKGIVQTTTKEIRLYFLAFIVILLFAEPVIIYKGTSNYLFFGTLMLGEYRKEMALRMTMVAMRE